MANEITVTWEPADVWVSDPRGTVAGAQVQITFADGTEVSGEIIPPEGGHPDCWLGELSGYHELIPELEHAAAEGASGRSGIAYGELDGD